MAKPKYCLKTIDGEVVTVIKGKRTRRFTLRAVDVQNVKKNGQRVCIQEKTIKGAKFMAFIFWLDGENYVLTVDDAGQLQLEEKVIKEPLKLCKCCWFEKCDIKSGNHYGLRSVVKPKRYICKRADKPFFLGTKGKNPVPVTNEKI